jgi:hypothetical protein
MTKVTVATTITVSPEADLGNPHRARSIRRVGVGLLPSRPSPSGQAKTAQ